MKLLLISVAILSLLSVSQGYTAEEVEQYRAYLDTVPLVLEQYIDEVRGGVALIDSIMNNETTPKGVANTLDSFFEEMNDWLNSMIRLQSVVNDLVLNIDLYKTSNRELYLIPKDQFDSMVNDLNQGRLSIENLQFGFTQAFEMNGKITSAILSQHIQALEIASNAVYALVKHLPVNQVVGSNIRLNLPETLSRVFLLITLMPDLNVTLKTLIEAV